MQPFHRQRYIQAFPWTWCYLKIVCTFRVQKKGGFTFLGKKWAGRNRKFGIIYAQTLIAHFWDNTFHWLRDENQSNGKACNITYDSKNLERKAEKEKIKYLWRSCSVEKHNRIQLRLNIAKHLHHIISSESLSQLWWV